MSGPRKRILALMSDGFGGGGGIAQFNRHLLRALAADERFDVDAIALYGSGDTSRVPAGLRWHAPTRGGKVGFGLAALRRVLLGRPDLILGGLVGFGPLARPLARLAGARLWTLTHGVEVWQRGRPGDVAGLAASDLVTTVSRCTRDRLLGWSDLDPGRVEVLHNTIDLTRFTPGPRPAELVERYGVANSKVLLTVARLDPNERYKGHDRVLRVLPGLIERIGDVHYVIAGSGRDRPRLEGLAREAGVADHVTFAGFVPDEDLEAHYRLADAFVMPSTGEGFGIVYLEAMACGCPVVAGNRDGSVDALADGELGQLVDPDDPDSLLRGIAVTLEGGRRHDARIAGVERFEIARYEERVRALAGRVLRTA